MYDLCSGSIEQSRGKLPQHKSLEEILKQELAWTLEQVGNIFLKIKCCLNKCSEEINQLVKPIM